ncbi:MAG TPA: hypothetical protein DDX14_05580, partial [Cyanobacteria bacterium UBA9579]|nr:hypothetical protein [Cyanobacteria bacterium UBA9579]
CIGVNSFQTVLIAVSITSIAFMVYILFKMADLLETSVKRATGYDHTFNKLYLVIFNIYYFNYMVNKLDELV